MSRIFIENLPKNFSENELRKRFSEKGQITDVQLKKEKCNAFIGYKSPEDAATAIEYFNKTFINTSRIKVKKADGFHVNKFNKDEHQKKFDRKKKQQDSDEDSDEDDEDDKAKSGSKSKEKYDPFEEVKDDPDFQAFLEVQRNVDLGKGKQIWKDDGVDDPGNAQDEDAADDNDNDEAASPDEGFQEHKPTAPAYNKKDKVTFDYTVKISGLPYKIKKRQLKDFFAPLSLKSLRFVPKVRGIAFVSFKTEADLNQALIKHRGFIDGNRIDIVKHGATAGPRTSSTDNNNNNNAATGPKEPKWKNAKAAEPIGESGRIYVRNLSYVCVEDDLKNLFEKFGALTEVFMPIDNYTKKPKGFAFVTFMFPEHAMAAFNELDKTDFQGRLLHILPAHSKEDHTKATAIGGEQKAEGGEEDSQVRNRKSEFKDKQKEEKKKAAQNPVNWNTLFIRPNAVADIMTKKFDVSKVDLLTKTTKQDNVAVRMALGETQIVNEVRQFLTKNGLSLEAFSRGPDCTRSKTVMLVKNLPAETKQEEISELFQRYGLVIRVILPPYGLTAVVEMQEPNEAKFAFKKLAYTNFKHHPLYLEWAPEDVFDPNVVVEADDNKEGAVDAAAAAASSTEQGVDEVPEENTSLFVKNINFKTINEDLKVHFEKIGRVHSANIAMKKNGSVLLSMGYGFVEFYKEKDAKNALKRLQNSVLHDHQLELMLSNRTVNRSENDTSAASAARKSQGNSSQTGTKICVKNIPFEATQHDIQKIFSVYGQVKSVRMPKKLTGTGNFRGFAFVDYVSKEEAKRAFDALRHSTHLYGRKLVLEWAKEETRAEDLLDSVSDAKQIGKKMARYFDNDQGSSAKRLKKSELRDGLARSATLKVYNDDNDAEY